MKLSKDLSEISRRWFSKRAGWGGLTLRGSDEGFPKTSDEDEGVLKNSFRSDGGGEQSGGGARKTACYFDGVLVSLCSHIYFRSVQMVSLFWGSCWFVRLSFSLEIEFRMLDQAVRIFIESVPMCLLLRDLLVCVFARFPRNHNGVKPGHQNQQHRQTDHPGRLCCWWCDWSGATGVGGLVIRTLQNSSPPLPFV